MRITATGFIAGKSVGFRTHRHEREYEFHLFTGGNGVMRNGMDRFPVREHSLCFTTPPEVHSADPVDPKKELHFFFARFIPSESDTPLITELRERFKSGPVIRAAAKTAGIFSEIGRKWRMSRDHALRSACHSLYAFMHDLVDEPASVVSDPGSETVDRLLALMQERIYCGVTLDELARHAGMERSHCIRVFKRGTGITPMTYFRELKLDTAAHLLRHSTLPVAQVAGRLGFYDQFHFSKAFRANFGVSPRGYRTRLP